MEAVEDDLLFTDLCKRISLLITDDDDHQEPTLHCPPVSFQVICQSVHPFHNQIPSFHDQYGRSREIKGTGVFIPQSSTNSRSKQSRFKYPNMRDLQTQRHINTSSGHLPHEPYNNHSAMATAHKSLSHKGCH